MMEFILKIILDIAEYSIDEALRDSIHTDTSRNTVVSPKVHDDWYDMTVSHDSYGRAAFDMAVLDQRMH